MDDEFSSALSEELSQLIEPPVGDLVGQAARRGRRIRRLRTVGAAVAVVTAVTVAALVGGSLTGAHGGSRRIDAATTIAASPSASADPSAPATPGASATPNASGTPNASATPNASGSPNASGTPNASGLPSASASASADGSLVPVTEAGLLQAVASSLPAGMTVASYSANPPMPPDMDVPSVFLHLNTGSGAGRIGVTAFKADTAPACEVPKNGHGTPMPGVTIDCFTDTANEQVQVLTNPTNAAQANTVTVYRHDGVAVAIDLSSSVMMSDGRYQAAPGTPTVAQAITLADNAAINYRMPAAYVQAAAAKYPHIPTA
jgi:hypothetical protein